MGGNDGRICCCYFVIGGDGVCRCFMIRIMIGGFCFMIGPLMCGVCGFVMGGSGICHHRSACCRRQRQRRQDLWPEHHWHWHGPSTTDF
jgi:hypothetical protein